MSDKIKPSEVSEVLLKELEGINQAEQFDEVGTVLTVADGVSMDCATWRRLNFSGLRMALWPL